jgi:hypothetical protein
MDVDWRTRFVGTIFLILAGLTLAWFLAPGTLGDESAGGLVLCPFKNLTGLPCPGCGMTRAFHHLVHLRFAEAAAANFLSFWLMFCALIELVNSVIGAARRGRPWFWWNEQFETWYGQALSYIFIATAVIWDVIRIVIIVNEAETPADVFGKALLWRLFMS